MKTTYFASVEFENDHEECEEFSSKQTAIDWAQELYLQEGAMSAAVINETTGQIIWSWSPDNDIICD